MFVAVEYVQIPLWSMNTKCLGDDFIVMMFRFLYGRWIRRTLPQNNSRFRFLYGRWIPPCQPTFSDNIRGSDSSMVDEYPAGFIRCVKLFQFRFLYGRWIRCYGFLLFLFYSCSDSSMVDEYLNKISWHNIIIPRSDSSMVDEYARTIHGWHLGQKVQIPLWSMNTEARGAERVMIVRSS